MSFWQRFSNNNYNNWINLKLRINGPNTQRVEYKSRHYQSQIFTMGFLKSAAVTVILAVLLANLPDFFKKTPEIPGPKGFVKPGWGNVKEAFKWVIIEFTRCNESLTAWKRKLWTFTHDIISHCFNFLNFCPILTQDTNYIGL